MECVFLSQLMALTLANNNSFDFIIIGAGAAGLLLADAMGKDTFFKDKSILLLEKEAKQTNDRTWCFWENGPGQFDALLHKSWNTIYFGGKQFSKHLDIAPYSYKMIRGIDFYREYLQRIQTYTNVTLARETVLDVTEKANKVKVKTSRHTFSASKVFNSIFKYKSILGQDKYPVLQQHFKGWFIRTEKPVFDPGSAGFMDFTIPQKGNTRFMYVLPFSANEGLVEYTLFSGKLLEEQVYDAAITSYIATHLQATKYQVLDKEKGNIPMSCYNFEAHNSANIFHIGTAGGWSKSSTGFTFMNTSRNIESLMAHIKKNKPLYAFSTKKRFWYYDLLLLDILHHNNEKGQLIFESLFRKRRPQLILKFLEEKTSFWEDIKIISACPKKEFITAFLRRIF